MASAITKTTLESNSFQNIFDIINTRSNVNDPRDPNNEKIRDFVYDSDPFEKNIGFNGYPYIFVSPPSLEQSKETCDGKHKLVQWLHEVVVRTKRSGSSGGNVAIGRTDILAIGDDLMKTFNSMAVRQTLYNNGLKLVDLKKIESDTTVNENDEIYFAIYELRYEQRMQVSS